MPGRWQCSFTTISTLDVEACWRPMVGSEAGDFHEIFELGDGRVVIAIGDAPGYGPVAAILARTLKNELRSAFAETDDVPQVLARLDARVQRAGHDVIATVACAVIDVAGRTIRASSAGHLPILFTNLTHTSFLGGVPDPPLGVAAERCVLIHFIPPDSTVFLFTDGLVERRGGSIADGLEALLESGRDIRGATAWASELARRTTERLGQPADDATVISLRFPNLIPANSAPRGR